MIFIVHTEGLLLSWNINASSWNWILSTWDRGMKRELEAVVLASTKHLTIQSKRATHERQHDSETVDTKSNLNSPTTSRAITLPMILNEEISQKRIHIRYLSGHTAVQKHTQRHKIELLHRSLDVNNTTQEIGV